MIQHRFPGIVITLIGVLTLLVLIPKGIVTPSNVTTLALSPDFWPRIVAAIFTFTGIALTIKPAVSEDNESFATFLARLPRLIVVLGALFGFYFSINQFGMVVPGILLIFGLMTFAGERRWLRMLCIAVVVPVLLYCFFVFVANIPIPLGMFESLRG